jgi:hypothetical protein
MRQSTRRALTVFGENVPPFDPTPPWFHLAAMLFWVINIELCSFYFDWCVNQKL